MRFLRAIPEPKIGNLLKNDVVNDHLGNVRVVLSDSKIITDNGTLGQLDPADSFQPEVRSSMAYYPFGMKMPGTEFYAGAKPRYDYNGKETDQESGTQDYGMRIYDSRIAKFLSEDPITKEYPELTPYQFASNTPVWAIDLDGLEAAIQKEDGTFTTPRDGRLSREVPAEAMEQFTPKGQPEGDLFTDISMDLAKTFVEPLYKAATGEDFDGNKVSATGRVLAGFEFLGNIEGKGGKGKQPKISKTNSQNIKEGAENVKREASATSRKKWEKHTGKKWPKDPNNPDKNQDVSHKKPLKDGGNNAPENIEPMPADKHRQMHKDNGDFKRWGKQNAEKRKSDRAASDTEQNDTNR